ncbi:hypothetical protein CPB84DRAFT_1854368 [Gymnopilus junonius]|uniref:Uncharacterized protein n=1 Tax=Gymnopilus junonius TaxID=109634 RepID=A0A9P5N7K8_GYMJU|nr:hypothetical protein CPB84DRAFT_1854368 [Gymnopilus junonius]
MFCDPENANSHIEVMKYLLYNPEETLRTLALNHDTSPFDIRRIFAEIFVAGTASNEDSELQLFSLLRHKVGLQYVFIERIDTFNDILVQHVEDYLSDTHLIIFLVLVDYAVTNQDSHFTRDWDFWYTEDLRSLRGVDKQPLAILEPQYGDSIGRLPVEYYRVLHGYLMDPSQSGKRSLDGDKYVKAVISILLMHKKKPYLVRFEYKQEHFFMFIPEWANIPEELIEHCKRSLD